MTWITIIAVVAILAVTAVGMWKFSAIPYRDENQGCTFWDGWNAMKIDGLDLKDNPHPPKSLEAQEWNEGWEAARAQNYPTGRRLTAPIDLR